MIILGIETSCDETSAAVLEVKNNKFNLLSHIIYSQITTHKKFGGVVPEIAARMHVQKILPIIDKAINKSSINLNKINAIAVTAGPGLATSLITGVHTAQVLSYLIKKPLIAVNHIEGHIAANLLESGIKGIKFPALCLTVSGGHTELIIIKKWGQYKVIGKTRDDAAGEAFDKVAKLLGLGYPGGPIVSKLATQAKKPIEFTSPMLNSADFDFSFSGLKTAVLYTVKDLEKKKKLTKPTIANICAGVEQSITKVLIKKTLKAAQKYKVKNIMIAGGVASNKYLRKELEKSIPKNIEYHTPNLNYCTDNAAMIAAAGYLHAKSNDYITQEKIRANPIWELGKKL